MSVMRVGSTTPATSNIEVFVAITKKQKLLNTVQKSSILDVTMDTKTRKYKSEMSYYDMWKLP